MLFTRLRLLIIGLIVWLWLTLSLAACDSPPPTRAIPTFAPRATSTPLPPAAKGSIVKVTRGTLDQSLTLRGSVRSAREAILVFKVRGSIANIAVAVGDQVKQGTVIAQLDDFQYDQDIVSAKYEADKAAVYLHQAQARLTSYNARIETINNLLPRYTELRDQRWQIYRLKAPTAADHSRALAEYNAYLDADADVRRYTTELNTLNTDRQITALDIELYQKQWQYWQQRIAYLQERYAGAKLVAPFDGLVVSIDRRVGEWIESYEPIGTLADPKQLSVEVNVPEADVASVSVGQAVRVTLDGFPDKNFSAKVKEIASQASIYQGKNVYRTVVTFDNLSQVPATLRMGADVAFLRASKENVLLVPTKAIQQDGLTQFVMVLRDNKWERAEVQVGVNGGNQTEIVSGLSEDEQILVP
jgi:RND family efflux transporter MFP subunit